MPVRRADDGWARGRGEGRGDGKGVRAGLGEERERGVAFWGEDGGMRVGKGMDVRKGGGGGGREEW